MRRAVVDLGEELGLERGHGRDATRNTLRGERSGGAAEVGAGGGPEVGAGAEAEAGADERTERVALRTRGARDAAESKTSRTVSKPNRRPALAAVMAAIITRRVSPPG